MIWMIFKKNIFFQSLSMLFYAMNNYSCLLLDNIERSTCNVPNKKNNLPLEDIAVNLDLEDKSLYKG